MDDRGETGLPAQVARKLQRSSASDLLGGGFIEGVDLGGDPVAQSEDADLRLFDLELRAALIPDSPWAVDAKARAESIRFGNENCILPLLRTLAWSRKGEGERRAARLSGVSSTRGKTSAGTHCSAAATTSGPSLGMMTTLAAARTQPTAAAAPSRMGPQARA